MGRWRSDAAGADFAQKPWVTFTGETGGPASMAQQKGRCLAALVHRDVLPLLFCLTQALCQVKMGCSCGQHVYHWVQQGPGGKSAGMVPASSTPELELFLSPGCLVQPHELLLSW